MPDANVPAPTGQPFGSQPVTQETAGSAMAARARAEVEAAYLIAINRPRDLQRVRERILADCARPKFAAKAKYGLPRTQWDPETRTRKKVSIRGFSIRFAEAAFVAYGNIRMTTPTTYEDDDKIMGEVMGVDLETNAIATSPWSVSKTMERKFVRDGDEVISERLNSDNQKVFTIRAPESEMTMRREAVIQRVWRNVVIKMLPPDLREDADELIESTINGEVRKDPKGAIKKLVDALAGLGVSVGQIAEYLGHNVDQMTVDEIAEFREMYSSLKDHEVTWSDILEAKKSAGTPPGQENAAERKALIERLARARIGAAGPLADAIKSAGLPANARFEPLSIDVLRKLAAAIDGGFGGSESSAPSAPDPEATQTAHGVDESKERASAIRLIGVYRTSAPKNLAEAFAASGLDTATNLEKVDIAVLQDILARMNPPKGAK